MNIRSSRTYAAPVPKMPSGLVELMEGLARDVLKKNPTEVYLFCAEYMEKLLQIRDDSTVKRLPTLKQKIATATKKTRDRAAQRREDFDKKVQLLQHVKREKNYDDELTKENNNEAAQYVLGNIVKVPQNDLTGDKEHEIIVGPDERNSLPLESAEVTEPKIVITSSEDDQSPRNELHDIEELGNESAEIVVNIDENDSLGDNNITNIDAIVIFKEDQDEENVRDETTNSEKEQSDSNLSNLKSVEDSTVSLTNDKLDSNNQNNNFEDKVIDEAEPTVSTEEQTTLINLQNSTVGFINSEPEDYKNDNDIVRDHINQTNDNQEENEKNDEADIGSNANNANTLEETQEKNETTLINNASISADAKKDNENNPEVKNIQITEPISKNNIEPNATIFDQSADNDQKSRHLETHGLIANTMDLETAAITIQKVFRSFLFRNKTSSIDDSINIDMNLLIDDKEKQNSEAISNNTNNKDRRTLGINRMDTVLQTVNEEKSLSLSTDDSSTLSSAATIIQAHVRGFLVRNNFNLNKTASSTSGIDSDAQSVTSLEGDVDYRKNKTVLNIRIVPEGGHFMSRDESMLTSIDLSLDGSPSSSTNLHPLGYDKSERRKQLKREDAIQSISPPSNNSGKLSEDVDSVKEILINGNNNNSKCEPKINFDSLDIKEVTSPTHALNDDNIPTMINNVQPEDIQNVEIDCTLNTPIQPTSLPHMGSDEMDVVTPFVNLEDTMSSEPDHNNIKLVHSGECHDVVLPTKVSRNDTSVVREFQNVLVYFLLWNNS